MDRRTLLASALLASGLAGGAQATSKAPVETINLWPNGAPGGEQVTVQEQAKEVLDQGRKGRDISGVREPRLSLHRPAGAVDTAVLVIPGGAFNRVVFDKEGEEVCAWLAGAGYAAGALLYRLPGEGWAQGADVMLEDAARALRVLARRTGARRIGVLGFSAGGTIAGALASRAAEVNYAGVDDADQLPLRLDFLGLGYPYLNLPASTASGPLPWRAEDAAAHLPLSCRRRSACFGRQQSGGLPSLAVGWGRGGAARVRARRARLWSAGAARIIRRRLARPVSDVAQGSEHAQGRLRNSARSPIDLVSP